MINIIEEFVRTVTATNTCHPPTVGGDRLCSDSAFLMSGGDEGKKALGDVRQVASEIEIF